jgi:hypothetical protein
MLVLAVSLTAAHAGAWTQPQGSHYGKLNARVIAGSQAFDLDGELQATESFSDLNIQAYYELGLTDHLTVVYSGTPLGRATYGGASSLYLGPNSVGVRGSLWDAHLKVAVEGRVGWSEPFGQTDLATTAASENTPDGFIYEPSVGNHWLDLEISAGRGVGKGWVTGSVGGRSNTGKGMGNAVIGFAQLGWVFKENIVADFHLQAYLPTTPVASVNIAGAGPTAYVSLGLGFGWWFEQHVGLALGIETAGYAISNAGAPSLTVGLQFR